MGCKPIAFGLSLFESDLTHQMNRNEAKMLLDETLVRFNLTPKEFYPYLREALTGSKNGADVLDIMEAYTPTEILEKIKIYLSKIMLINKWKNLLTPSKDAKVLLIEPQESIPTAFVRKDDGQRMSLNDDKTYSWDFQKADPEHIIYKYNLNVMLSYVLAGQFDIESYTTK